MIHAGNASQISDGASAVLLATPQRAAELGLTPIARYHSGAVSGADPLEMLTGPNPATARVLKKSGLSVGEIGAFEVNEAFAPVPLAWLKEIGGNDEAIAARLNPLGGAIAVGHPLGASGHGADDATDPPHARPRHPLRAADHVRGWRHGERDDRRAAPGGVIGPDAGQ